MMSTTDTFRLFVAVSIPQEVKARLAEVQSYLRQALPQAHIRWTQPELHLTLRFLGNVEAQRLPQLAEAVIAACKGFAPLKLRAARLGCFPNTRRPRVIWVGNDDASAQLAALQRAIQTATQEFTTEEPEPNFSGHVTLGRIKEIQRQETDVLARAITNAAQKAWGEWTADHVEIMRSELCNEGAKHVLAASVNLGIACTDNQ